MPYIWYVFLDHCNAVACAAYNKTGPKDRIKAEQCLLHHSFSV